MSEVEETTAPDGSDVDGLVLPRPTKRADCEGGARPCPYVGCKYNLFLDVSSTGNIRFSFPNRPPEAVDPEASCALDLASSGGLTLQEVADVTGVTRERVRQIEMKSVRRLRLVASSDLGDDFACDDDEGASDRVEVTAIAVVTETKEQTVMSRQPTYSKEEMTQYKQVIFDAPSDGISFDEFVAKTGLAEQKARYVVDRLTRTGQVSRVSRGRWAAPNGESVPAKKRRSLKKKSKPVKKSPIEAEVERLRASRERIINDAVKQAGVEEDIKKINKAIAAFGG